jgi:hypothetical protein
VRALHLPQSFEVALYKAISVCVKLGLYLRYRYTMLPECTKVVLRGSHHISYGSVIMIPKH